MREPLQMGDDDWWDAYTPDLANYDCFVQDLYSFFYFRGVRGTLVNTLVQQVVLGFTIIFSIFAMACIRWDALMACRDEKTCHSIGWYVDLQWLYRSSGKTAFMVLYFTTMLVVWLFSLVQGLMLVSRTRAMATLYRQMDISDATIGTMQWSEVLERVKRHYTHLDAQSVVNRIMRKDNYLIALAHHGMLEVQLCGVTVPHCRLLEASLHLCLFSKMFNIDYSVREGFLYDRKRLARHLFRCGLLQAVLCPFSVLFIICHFFMRHIQDWHTQRNYFGPRVYGLYGKLRLREYNELPHLLERRIALSYKDAHRYMQLFPNPVLAAICKGLMFVSGSLVTLLLLFTVLEENILIHVTLAGRPLLFYLTVLSTIFAVSRACAPPYDKPVRFTAEECMERIADHTHHFPASWKGRCHTALVRQEFAQLYRWKLLLLWDEIVGTLLCPWALMLQLADRAPAMLEFLRKHTRQTEAMGAICSYGSFDIVTDTEDNKLGQSLLSFSQTYPSFCQTQTSRHCK